MIVILSFVIWHSAFSPARAQHYGYTDERPLVIACDWDFQPFEFMNAEGQPAGFNIEVLDKILTQKKIPHKFVMQEWHTVNEMFIRREADLIHTLSNSFKGHPYVSTKKYINYYTLRTVRRHDMPPLNSFRNLGKEDTLLLKEDDYAAQTFKAMGQQPFVIRYTSPKSALTALRGGESHYFIWGELPLKRKINELHIDSLVLDEIDLPAGELCIIGYDYNIVNMIDDEYTRLEQNGDIQLIHDRWFHPERRHDNASPWAPYILAGVIFASLLALLFSRLITVRVRKAVRHSSEINSMMLQALSMGAYYVLEHDIRTGMVTNRHGRLLPKSRITVGELIGRTADDQQEDFQQKLNAMVNGEADLMTVVIRWNAGSADRPNWRNLEGSAILERASGKPRYIVHTIKDVTREVGEEAHNQDLNAKYKLLFDTNILAMAFYDKEGWLLEYNQKMAATYPDNEKIRQFFRQTRLFDLPTILDEYSPHSRESFHACQYVYYPSAAINLYIENKIVPLFDENDELIYYISTVRDITAEREMYLQERRHERQLVEASETVRRYDRQLSYLLEENRIYVWTYDPKTDLVHVSRKPHITEYAETLNQFMEGVPGSCRAAEFIKMREFIARQEPFNTTVQFDDTPLQHKACWFSVSGMPEHNAEGQLVRFFGIARDISELMAAQERLRKETLRAEDSGRMKSAFLANMTHEIRTPLNAIVGFSELLQMIDDQQERLEFIRIIRNNCDMLLRLINDILEASSMGQSLAIEPKELDLSRTFNDICLSLEQRVQEPGVAFIKDNPYPAYTAVLDAGRLQQLLTNFVTNAVKYTRQGHIRVGYREENGGLFFYCEDTGAGIPAEKQASVFERFVKLNDFVQGTGLGLSICRAIVEKCGGRIGVESEGEGHGSTFWFWIPREIKTA